MPDAYSELLDATLRHLESLAAQGVRHVSVSPSALAALSDRAPRRPAPPAPRSAHTGSMIPPVTPAVVSPEQGAFTTLLGGVPAPTVGPPLSPEGKQAAMADLRARAAVCQKCPNLAAARRNVVFGVGDIHSPLMFVGEAPGADEDEQGEPFVGRAGQLLTRIIQTMGFSRETVYIGNILKCRPDTPGQTAGNRKPTSDEMRTCLPYLLEQIDLIQPRVIVALGATAVEGLLGKTAGITRLRGQWQTFRGISTMPTYHPAYLLRNQALSEKRKVWEDMLRVLERLERPITEKQRNYFLKA